MSILLLSMLWHGCAKSIPAPDDPPAPEPPTLPEVQEAPAAEPEVPVHRCGGIAGRRCPLPLVCTDDPSDDCLPGRGMDCPGRCVSPEEAPSRPGQRRPAHHDPRACKTWTPDCAEGEVPYSDASGCGCEVSSSPIR